jgi:hypothetical protein
VRWSRWSTSIAAAVALASQTGCGFAQRAGKGAAEGVLGTLGRKLSDGEGLGRVKGRVLGGTMRELSQPEQLDDIQRIAAAVAAGTVSGASRAASGAMDALALPGGRGGRGAQEATPVEAIAEQASRAFSRQVVADRGPAGDGALATSLSAMTERMAGAMARGAQGDLAPLFPECRGADASGCLDRTVERLSRASSAGVAAGIRESLGVWPFVFAFGGGALSTLALAWAWGIYRARRPERIAGM